MSKLPPPNSQLPPPSRHRRAPASGGFSVNVNDIEIHAGEPGRPYRVIGSVKARSTAATIFSKAPTLEDVNFKLRERALKRGANAVIKVRYTRGISAVSWKAMTAYGTAVFMESDERTCPHCAETIKLAAKVCRFCGRDVPAS